MGWRVTRSFTPGADSSARFNDDSIQRFLAVGLIGWAAILKKEAKIRAMTSRLQPPVEKVRSGLAQMEDGVLDFLRERGSWVSHPDLQDALGLRSEYKDGHSGFLSGAILDRLCARKLVERRGGGRGNLTYYKSAG
jgi:hypothetical protein